MLSPTVPAAHRFDAHRTPLRALAIAAWLHLLTSACGTLDGGAPRAAAGIPPGKPLPSAVATPDAARPAPWSDRAFRHGVVTASDPLAAEAGAEILGRGGNAIDAAAAMQFVLNVVEPQSSGIGGGGLALIHLAARGETLMIDSRETAPAAVTPGMFAADPTAGFGVLSTSGYAVGVPGTLKGVAMALERFGTISLAEALQPAIAAAANGIVVGPRLAESIAVGLAPNGRLASEPGDAAYDAARSIFAPGGRPLRQGETLVQADLAATLRAIAEGGIDAFYACDHPSGIARAIIDTQQATRTANPGGAGRMVCDDLAAYDVRMRQPSVAAYRDYTIRSASPPSSGGLTVAMMLKLLERFPIGDAVQGFGFGQVKTLNVMMEAMRIAFADRAVWMGDADFVEVPESGLLSADYLRLRGASCSGPDGTDPDPGDAFYCIRPGSRIETVVAGDPRPFQVPVATSPAAAEEGIDTTHFTVIDAHGNIVSFTATIESAWGTGLMVRRGPHNFGFLLNNELTDFNIRPQYKPPVPPSTAPVNPGANDVAAGKRPRSSMAPSIIFARDERGREQPILAFGSPGGSSIINTVLNVTLNLLDHRMAVQTAIDAPRLSLAGTGSTAAIEAGFDPAVLRELGALGYDFGPPAVLGSVQAVAIDLRSGEVYGGADGRRQGTVIGPP